jgi:hypothetical protein
MSRRTGIVIVFVCIFAVVSAEWLGGNPPDPYRAPDPMAFGSTSGASGAICSFAPGASK